MRLLLLVVLFVSSAEAQNHRGVLYKPGPHVRFDGGVGEATFTLNESGDRTACTFQPEESATITECCFRQTARTGSPTSYRIGIQGVSATTGAPDETWVQSATVAPSAGAQNICATFTGVSVSPSTWRACVIQSESGVDGSNNITLRRSWNNSSHESSVRVWTKDGVGAYTAQSSPPSCWWRSSTKTYGFPTATDFQFHAGTAEYATRFVLPTSLCSTAKVAGLWVNGRFNTTADADIRLYSGGAVTDTTALHTTTVDKDIHPYAFNGHTSFSVLFTSPQTVTCGDVYRISATNFEQKGFDSPTNADLTAWSQEGTEWFFSSRSGGNWTDTNTRRLITGLILDDLTPPSGGGGLKNHNNVSGGAQ
jgi:hypothetical protein